MAAGALSTSQHLDGLSSTATTVAQHDRFVMERKSEKWALSGNLRGVPSKEAAQDCCLMDGIGVV